LELSGALLYAAFVVTAICSVGYHTLAARSIIVGIASAAATPWTIALGVHLFIYYVLRQHIELGEKATVALVLSACAAYSGFSLWLGHRQFVRLELKDSPVSRSAQVPEVLVPTRLTELFRARPTTPVWNLICKEICLQKPIFLVSAIFTAAWLSMLLLMVLMPAWQDDLVGVLHGLTGAQVVLMVILTGCVALGDDKALGTTAWHLTLPISIRRQWTAKLLVSAATLVGTALLLPVILAALTLFKARVGLLDLRPGDLLGMSIPCLAVFVVSFWSASMVTNTVRAALMTMFTLVLLGFTTGTANWLATQGGGLQTPLLTWFVAETQRPPGPFSGAAVFFVTVALGLGAAFLTLTQSLQVFRHLNLKPSMVVWKMVTIFVAVFAIAFWRVDFGVSVSRNYHSLVQAVLVVLQKCPLDEAQLWPNPPVRLTLADLQKHGRFSPVVERWLRNSTIEVRRTQVTTKSRITPRGYLAEVHLPSGVIVPFTWISSEKDSQTTINNP
jgi:hypothetical protein